MNVAWTCSQSCCSIWYADVASRAAVYVKIFTIASAASVFDVSDALNTTVAIAATHVVSGLLLTSSSGQNNQLKSKYLW